MCDHAVVEKNVNIHSSVLPLRRAEVYQVVNVDSTLLALQYQGKFFSSWFGKALSSHHFLEVRKSKIRPSLDDKILTSWNALLIKGFCTTLHYICLKFWR